MSKFDHAPAENDAALARVEGEAILAARQLPDALACFDLAEAAGDDPDRCSAGRWMAFMLLGDFEAAWRESDRIQHRNRPDPNRFWHGECLAGKRVILRCLHGYGDTVQFLRYAPRLQAIVAHLLVEVPPRFAELARHFDGVIEVITWGDRAPAQPPLWDVQIEVMELPYIFRTHLSELPLATKYLHLPRPLVLPRSHRFRVGISWTAGAWNSSRAIPLKMLNPILSVEGCEFWSLDGVPECGETPPPAGGSIGNSMHRDDHCRDNIEGLAAKIAQLDLVITVDTLAAHLAGALGITAWVLLQHSADWRWMDGRDDSPWYPSLRLFRQPAPQDWSSVIASVREELRKAARPRIHDANGNSGQASYPA